MLGLKILHEISSNCKDHEWNSFRQQHDVDCNHDIYANEEEKINL